MDISSPEENDKRESNRESEKQTNKRKQTKHEIHLTEVANL